MRRRWQIDPAFFSFLVGAQFVAGLVGFLIVGALTIPCDQFGCGLNSNAPLSTGCYIALALWAGPWLLALVGAGVVGAAVGLWTLRPRRVQEPVLEDLRQAGVDA